MSAFGKKGNAGGLKPGGRPAFGVARPMKGSGGAASGGQRGGEQFPPIPGEPAKAAPVPPASPSRPTTSAEAIDRLNERMASVNRRQFGSRRL